MKGKLAKLSKTFYLIFLISARLSELSELIIFRAHLKKYIFPIVLRHLNSAFLPYKTFTGVVHKVEPSETSLTLVAFLNLAFLSSLNDCLDRQMD